MRSGVLRAHLYVHRDQPRGHGTFDEPLDDATSDAALAQRRADGEKHEMRVLVAVAHDAEAGQRPAVTRDQAHGVAIAQQRRDALWRIRPAQPGLT